MGCTASSPSSDVGAGKKVGKPMKILVVGAPGAGVTTLCKRFTEKCWVADTTSSSMGSGTSPIQIRGTNCPLTLLDCRDPDASLADADGIIYAVDSVDEEPFKGIFRHMELLQARGQESGVMSSFAGASPGSPVSGDSSGSLHRLSGVKISPRSLQVITTPTPKPRRGSSWHTDHRLPMVVVVTKSDVLLEKGSERRIARVKAMASNWCTANRSQAFLISSLTGHGCARAIGAAVQEIVLSRQTSQSSLASSVQAS